ncbi:S8/S53 family peptidase [Mycolicibacterium parafortuitum]|uniref:Protease [Geobacillus thermoleovorans CCB_US3_UF5] n=1 Tax=Mycolicibacterium parafortuitum TaxID=39692 RepID=A0A375YGI7_MYCPF|nr:S8/S53 family peptidase [Mycolicibacterium parafortuitum]ORB25872.1 hypothetical protein BST38_26835 [Mycolicibacterium parafortuitum]SRX80200.1 protease [Geobacillus thermoleovorans CCB_US3_UF5] [Mycolicibacterium parafortuitum]
MVSLPHQIPDEVVRPYSFAAKAAHQRSVSGRRRAGAVHVEGGGSAPELFVENELLVSSDYPDGVEYLVRELGGTRVPDRPLPHPPAELGRPRRSRPADGVATRSVKVVFREPPQVPDAAAALEQIAPASGRLTFSSPMAAAVAAAAASLEVPQGSVGLNRMTDVSSALPRDPGQRSMFGGRSRVADAGQLVDSYRLAGCDPAFTTLAIMDRGFRVAASDAGVLAVNAADDSRDIGGRDENGGWHGHHIAGVAASGGSVARPLLMRFDDIASVMRGIRVCAAWGVDVVNMSFTVTTSEWSEFWSFPDTDWVNTFRFAERSGVVVVVAAGNDGRKLPDARVRPATRTPGVITVGALDSDDESAAQWSNHGSSVSIWAPGTGVPVGLDGDSPRGATADGTSFSAPLVAATAAMMRAVAPELSNTEVRTLLLRTGWRGHGRVGTGLDAYAAVEAALAAQLPAPSDAGATASSARPLAQIRPGVFAPQPDTYSIARSDRGVDHWSFSLDDYSAVAITVNFHARIADLELDLLDSCGHRVDFDGADRLAVIRGDGALRASGVIPQGDYVIRVSARGSAAYRLEVSHTAVPLRSDRFESNNTFDDATVLRFARGPLDLSVGHGPGTFGLTLHRRVVVAPVFPNTATSVVDSDHFQFHVPAHDGKRIPTVTIASDKPLTAALFDEFQRPIQVHEVTTAVTLTPPERTHCYLKISGTEQTRYRLGLRMMADPRVVVADLPAYEVLPPWWVDSGPLPFPEPLVHFGVELVTEPDPAGTVIGESVSVGAATAADLPVTAELLHRDGRVVGVGEQNGFGRIDIATDGLLPGMYAVRLTRPADIAINGLRLLAPVVRRGG